MHLISVRNLRKDAARYSDAVEKVEKWYKNVKQAKWQHLEKVREVYPNAEAVGSLTVFNIKSYRLIVGIDYTTQTIYYKYFLTHSEYEKGAWKDDPHF